MTLPGDGLTAESIIFFCKLFGCGELSDRVPLFAAVLLVAAPPLQTKALHPGIEEFRNSKGRS